MQYHCTVKVRVINEGVQLRVAKKWGPEGPGNSNNAPIGQGEYRYLREREVTSCQASFSSCLHNGKVHGLSVLGNTSQRLYVYSSDY